jgi:hypothetical protein
VRIIAALEDNVRMLQTQHQSSSETNVEMRSAIQGEIGQFQYYRNVENQTIARIRQREADLQQNWQLAERNRDSIREEAKQWIEYQDIEIARLKQAVQNSHQASASNQGQMQEIAELAREVEIQSHAIQNLSAKEQQLRGLETAHQALIQRYQEEAQQVAEQNAYAHRVYNDLLEHRAQNERMRKRTADLQQALRQADDECNRLRGGDANLIRQLQHQHAQDAGLIQQLHQPRGWSKHRHLLMLCQRMHHEQFRRFQRILLCFEIRQLLCHQPMCC